MSVETYSSHDFTHNVSAAKRAAQKGPVFITDCGQPAFVLLKIEDYWHLAGQREESLYWMLWMPFPVVQRVGQPVDWRVKWCAVGALSSSRRACKSSFAPPSLREARVWLKGVRATFAGRILPFTDNTATFYAAMHVPNPRSDRGAMIAATALEHGMTMVTRNVADFVGTCVLLINPFD